MRNDADVSAATDVAVHDGQVEHKPNSIILIVFTALQSDVIVSLKLVIAVHTSHILVVLRNRQWTRV